MKADERFDNALRGVQLDAKPRKMRPRLQRYLDEQLLLAEADPQGWARTHREDIRRAARRPRIHERLHEDFPEFTVGEHAEFLDTLVTTGGPVGEWSEEKKAKWSKWINRVIPALKILAAICPPPYNLAIVLLIVVLTLIDKNRLQPAEMALAMAA